MLIISVTAKKWSLTAFPPGYSLWLHIKPATNMYPEREDRYLYGKHLHLLFGGNYTLISIQDQYPSTYSARLKNSLSMLPGSYVEAPPLPPAKQLANASTAQTPLVLSNPSAAGGHPPLCLQVAGLIP